MTDRDSLAQMRVALMTAKRDGSGPYVIRELEHCLHALEVLEQPGVEVDSAGTPLVGRVSRDFFPMPAPAPFSLVRMLRPGRFTLRGGIALNLVAAAGLLVMLNAAHNPQLPSVTAQLSNAFAWFCVGLVTALVAAVWAYLGRELMEAGRAQFGWLVERTASWAGMYAFVCFAVGVWFVYYPLAGSLVHRG